MQTNENRYLTYLTNYSRALSICMFLFGVYYYFTIDHIVLILNSLILSPLTFMTPFLYKKIKSKIICSNLTILYSFIYVTVLILCTGGINSWVLTWYIVGPILSGLLGGNIALYSWGLLVPASIILLYYFDPVIQQLPFQITDPVILAKFKMRSLIVPTFLSIFLTSRYIKLMTHWVHEVENKNISIRNLLRLVSHDIANPLSLIYGATKQKVNQHQNSSSNEYQSWFKIHKATMTIKNILEQVRKMQALDSGKLDLQLTPVCVKDVFEKGKFIFQEKIEKKNLKLIYDSPDDSLHVLAEETSFSNQVINNILSNAIKFSPSDSTIHLKVVPQFESVDLIIRDQGIGIPPEILDKLFDENAKTSRKGVLGEEGTGFGMPIVKLFVEKYGGAIKVESNIGSDDRSETWTEFRLTLKRAS